MDSESPISELTTEKALEFLSKKSLGRLAISLEGKPDVFPINFAIQNNGADDVVAYIRTSPGNKLFATATGGALVLEADEVEDSTATSVIVYGTGRIVEDPDELARVEALDLKAWIAVEKTEVIAIDVERISGRRFNLGEPDPEMAIPEAPD